MNPNNNYFFENDSRQEIPTTPTPTMMMMMMNPNASITYGHNDDSSSYASRARTFNQFEPAGQESYNMQEVDIRQNEIINMTSIPTPTPIPIRNAEVDVNCHLSSCCERMLDHDPSSASAIPRSGGDIYYGIEPNSIIESIISSSAQNSDRGSPASSDGQVLSMNYELYNPSSFNPHISISDFTTPTSSSSYETTITATTANNNSGFAMIDGNSMAGTSPTRPAIRQHFWIQRAQITPTRTLNGHVSEVYNDGVITFFCAWPGCTHPIGFAHKAQVITHVRSAHLQEKPYVCTTCNTTFARKQDANRHVVSLNRVIGPIQEDITEMRMRKDVYLKLYPALLPEAKIFVEVVFRN